MLNGDALPFLPWPDQDKLGAPHAPIELYPDGLLSPVLMASTYRNRACSLSQHIRRCTS